MTGLLPPPLALPWQPRIISLQPNPGPFEFSEGLICFTEFGWVFFVKALLVHR